MDDILARIQELARKLPEPPQAARVEVGQGVLRRLKTAARPKGAPAENRWTPPSPFGSLIDVPIVQCDDLGPGVWRVIDRDGQVLKEGRL